MYLRFTKLILSGFAPKTNYRFLFLDYRAIAILLLLKISLGATGKQEFIGFMYLFMGIFIIRTVYQTCRVFYYSFYVRYKIFALKSFLKFYFGNDNMFVYTQAEFGYNFNWNEFSTYYIKNKSLFLIQNDLHYILKFDLQITGVENFNLLFNEAMERLKRLG